MIALALASAPRAEPPAGVSLAFVPASEPGAPPAGWEPRLVRGSDPRRRDGDDSPARL